MIASHVFQEDQELKRLLGISKDERPRFDWRGVACGGDANGATAFKVRVLDEHRDFDLGEIAETIGNALADLLIARNKDETDIFTEENKVRVRFFSLQVAQELHERARQAADRIGDDVEALTAQDIYHAIEHVLVRQNEHAVARSVIARRQRFENLSATSSSTPMSLLVPTKVIRRNGRMAAWNPNKIEAAVCKAFVSLEQDATSARLISEAVTQRMIAEGAQHIHIEQVQDLVEEELMRQGHYRVAKAYIQFRAMRVDGRDREAREAALRVSDTADDRGQQEMVVVRIDDKTTVLWDGVDLKKRVDFAILGLDLCLLLGCLLLGLLRPVGMVHPRRPAALEEGAEASSYSEPEAPDTWPSTCHPSVSCPQP